LQGFKYIIDCEYRRKTTNIDKILNTLNLLLFLQEDKTCDFSKTVGTNFPMQSDSKEAQEWFMRFKELGLSNITDFDWATLDEESQSEATILEESITVTAGTIVELYQIVGECGGRTIWTGLVNPMVYSSTNETELEAVELTAGNSVRNLIKLILTSTCTFRNHRGQTFLALDRHP
jgi:hypothetical protein